MLTKLKQFIDSLLLLFPPYRKKKEREEYERQERLKRHERYIRSKGCRFSFVGKYPVRSIDLRGSSFSVTVIVEGKRGEHYHYCTRLGVPPRRNSGYFLYSYSERRGGINERRFFRLLEIVEEYPGMEITVEGSASLHDIIEDTENIMAPRFLIKDPDTNEDKLIWF